MTDPLDISPSSRVRARGLLRVHGETLMRLALAEADAERFLLDQPGILFPRRYVEDVVRYFADHIFQGELQAQVDCPTLEEWTEDLPARNADRLATV